MISDIPKFQIELYLCISALFCVVNEISSIIFCVLHSNIDLNTILHAFVFRILGDELSRLRTLSVCYCGLEDLDGINYCPNIVNLCAADNNINDVYPITELRRIHTLDLEKYDFQILNRYKF